MKLSKKLLCVFFICGSSLGYSQISSPININNSNRSIYNPAFAGIEDGTSLGYRSSIKQHRFHPNPIFNNGFDFNGKSKKLNSGYGINIGHNFEESSTRDNPFYTSNPNFDHSTRKYQNLYVKFNYNYQLTLGENSVLALGTSVGMSFIHSKTIDENSNEKNYNGSLPVFSLGMRYQYRNFFIGSSVGSLTTQENKPFIFGSYLSVNTGFNWEINEHLSIEPSLFLDFGINQVKMLQSNFVYLKKYNLGAGYYDKFNSLYGPHHGFHVFAGVTIKEKLGLNLAYQKITRQFEVESQEYWLNKSGLELNVNYKFN